MVASLRPLWSPWTKLWTQKTVKGEGAWAQREASSQRWKKYFIFCQPDKKIENFLPHSRNFKWGLWIYICRNHIIYINLDTFTTIMSIFTSYFIKLMDYTQTISIFKKYFLPNFECRKIFCQLGWQDLPLFPPLLNPHPPKTVWRVLGIPGGQHLICRLHQWTLAQSNLNCVSSDFD